MFLSRLLCSDGQPALALRQGSEAALLRGAPDLAALLAEGRVEAALTEALLRSGVGQPVDIAERLAQGRVLLPVAGRAVLAPMTPGEEALPIRLVAPGCICPTLRGLRGWWGCRLFTCFQVGGRSPCVSAPNYIRVPLGRGQGGGGG